VKSLSFLFPNPTNVSGICEGLLAACVSSDGRPLRCVATGMLLLISDCVWFRLISCIGGRGGGV
jgi:hypothetical protein